MLKFIKETELKIRRFENILNAISDKDNAIIDEVEEMAISEIKSYQTSTGVVERLCLNAKVNIV